MSINLYLDNKLKELDGFKSAPYSKAPGNEMSYNGMHVFNDNGRLYIMCGENSLIPDELKDLVEEVTWHDSIPQMGYREAGVYRHETAECELVPSDSGGAKREKLVYGLKLKAKNLEDIKILLHKVKTGTIRPEESYEGKQTGMSREQLEQELKRVTSERDNLSSMILEAGRQAGELTHERNRLAADLQSYKDALTEENRLADQMRAQILAVKALCNELCLSLQPFCTKTRIIEKFRAIFKNPKTY